MKRLLDLANQQLIYMVLFVAMTVTSSPGPTWPTVAKYAVGAAVGIGCWTLRDRFTTQDVREHDQQERDRKQDEAVTGALKEIAKDNRDALDRFGTNNDKAMQQVRDLSSSAVTRASEAITAGIELGKAVNEIKDQLKDERQKREAKDAKELEDLRQAKGRKP